uniref:Cell wall protein-like n=1 Tax=Oryza sativa subsp. japonica TaxID=39947 RepID=Q69LU7_ORYSJ|nr:cell wall protein-like [Oryza sativa Japonica Group]BAD62083.1 cell wall protein-like [Oryza sativa Japonica Group]
MPPAASSRLQPPLPPRPCVGHGVTRISPERCRPRRLSLGLIGTHSGSLFRRASAPADVAISTSGIAATRSPSASPPLHPNPSAVHRRCRPLAGPVIVVAFVPPSSRSRSSSSLCQVSRCSPVVVFVLGSASSSLVLAVSRLRPRIAAEVVRLRCPRAVSATPVHVCVW